MVPLRSQAVEVGILALIAFEVVRALLWGTCPSGRWYAHGARRGKTLERKGYHAPAGGSTTACLAPRLRERVLREAVPL